MLLVVDLSLEWEHHIGIDQDGNSTEAKRFVEPNRVVLRSPGTQYVVCVSDIVEVLQIEFSVYRLSVVLFRYQAAEVSQNEFTVDPSVSREIQY